VSCYFAIFLLRDLLLDGYKMKLAWLAGL